MTIYHDGDTYVCETDELRSSDDLKLPKGAIKMIDWKRKLTSRKLWAAVCALATNLIIIFGGTQEVAVQVTAIIMAGASVIAYIIGEGLVDAASAGMIDYEVPVEEIEPPDEGEG